MHTVDITEHILNCDASSKNINMISPRCSYTKSALAFTVNLPVNVHFIYLYSDMATLLTSWIDNIFVYIFIAEPLLFSSFPACTDYN